jgi:hypothetical protein
MTKFNQQGPFSEVVAGSASQEQWDAIFGKRRKMRCPNGCRPIFCRRADYPGWVWGGDPAEWVCAKCGTKIEYVDGD